MYGRGVRRLRPATAQEDAASARSWADGHGGWIGLGPDGAIYSLTEGDTSPLTPGATVVYVSDRPATTSDGLGVLVPRLARQAADLLRHRTRLFLTLAWQDRADRASIQARGPILRDALGDTTPDESDIRLTADVVALAQLDGQTHVLLVRRGHDPYAGLWALPGGHVDPGESIPAAAARELAEETGIVVAERLLDDVGTYDAPGRDPRGHYVTHAFLTELTTPGTPTAGDDAAAARWVPITQALSDGLAFDHERILRDALGLAGCVTLAELLTDTSEHEHDDVGTADADATAR
ncbi:NUDIX hydrolase [Frankia sp. CH37]|nr:NUDIX hydrolase [Parafrankia sp. CH37]